MKNPNYHTPHTGTPAFALLRILRAPLRRPRAGARGAPSLSLMRRSVLSRRMPYLGLRATIHLSVLAIQYHYWPRLLMRLNTAAFPRPGTTRPSNGGGRIGSLSQRLREPRNQRSGPHGAAFEQPVYCGSPITMLTLTPSEASGHERPLPIRCRNFFSSAPTRRMQVSRTYLLTATNYAVMASDTDLNWFLIRVLANTLIDATNSTSAPSVVATSFTSLPEHLAGVLSRTIIQPVYPTNFFLPPASSTQVSNAAAMAEQAALRD